MENARLLAVEKSQNGRLAAIFPGSLRMLADGAPTEWYYNGELVTAEMWKAIYAEMKRLYQARREQTTL